MSIFDWRDLTTWPDFLGKRRFMDEPIDEELMWQFYNRYDYIKTYHASRLADPQLVLDEGLSIGNYYKLSDAFIKYCKEYLGIKISIDQIDRARDDIGVLHNGSVFVVLDDRDLLKYSAHYLFYGPEFIQALAVRTLGSVHKLSGFGVPTVFEIHLDIESISETELGQLTTVTNNSIFEGDTCHYIDFSFELRKPIPSVSISSYYKPKGAVNAENGFKYELFN